MGISERGFRKVLKRYREKGDEAVVHGLRGRPSARRLEAGKAVKAVDLVKRAYRDFGPTLAAEYLERKHGIGLSRETLRKLLVKAGIWKAKPRKSKRIHVWRERRGCRGELVQWDTSVHAWLEQRGPEKMYLISVIDDATSTLFACFVRADSTVEHMRVLGMYLELYGRPQAVYTDKAGLFQPTLAPGWKTEEPGPKTETQMGRAFRELGIEWIAAHSPQAKGRVERCFGTLQDRLVKGLRKAGVNTMENANEYLKREFLPLWNTRFIVAAASAVNAHRPAGEKPHLASVLSLTGQRKAMNDYTVCWKGRRWQIPKSAVVPGLRGSSVRIEQRLDGSMVALLKGKAVQLHLCPRATVQPATEKKRLGKRFVPPPGRSRWMDHFSVRANTAAAVSTPLRSPSGLPAPG